MADPKNPGLHPQVQHVINSLEAHFAAIGEAMAKGAPEWMATHVETAFADVKASLDKLGVEFAQEFETLKARLSGGQKAAEAQVAAAAKAA